MNAREPNSIAIFVTTGSEEEARAVAQLLLSHRKAACINIVPKVDSLFCWQGNLDSAQESLLIIKTRASLLPEVVELVKGAHSYEVPEVIAVPIIGGNEDYLRLIEDEVSG